MRSVTIVPMRHRFCLCFGFLVAAQFSTPIPKAVAQRAAPTSGKATVKPVPPQPEEYQKALQLFAETLIAWKAGQLERVTQLAEQTISRLDAVAALDFPGKNPQFVQRDLGLMLFLSGIAHLKLSQQGVGSVRIAHAQKSRSAVIRSIEKLDEIDKYVQELGLPVDTNRKRFLDEATKIQSEETVLKLSVSGGGAIKLRLRNQEELCRSATDRGCDLHVTLGSPLVVEAVADEGTYVAQWHGGCPQAASSVPSAPGEPAPARCELTPSGPIALSATFLPRAVLNITTQGDGSGAIVVKGSGREDLRCGPSEPCTLRIAGRPEVQLLPKPTASSRFVGFLGDCQGKSCLLSLSQDRSVTAAFRKKTEAKWWVWTLVAGGTAVVATTVGIGTAAALRPIPSDIRSVR